MRQKRELIATTMSKGSSNVYQPDAFISIKTIKEEVQDSSDGEHFPCAEDEDRYSVCLKGHLLSSLEFVEVKHELPDPDESEESPNSGVWSESSFEAPVEFLEVKQVFPDDCGSEEIHNEGRHCTPRQRPQRAASKNVYRIVADILRDKEEVRCAYRNQRDRKNEASHRSRLLRRQRVAEAEAEEVRLEESLQPVRLRACRLEDLVYRKLRDKNNEASRKSRLLRRQREAEAEAEVVRLEESVQRLRLRARRLEDLVVWLRKLTFSFVAPNSASAVRAGPSEK